MYNVDFEQRLTRHKNGANAHTINKTVHYHRIAHRQGRPDFVEMLEKMADAAIASGDWKPLSDRLAGYW